MDLEIGDCDGRRGVLRRRVRRRLSNSFSNDSWKEVESSASSGVRLLTDL